MEGHPKGSVMLAGHIRSARGWDSSCPARAGVKACSLKCQQICVLRGLSALQTQPRTCRELEFSHGFPSNYLEYCQEVKESQMKKAFIFFPIKLLELLPDYSMTHELADKCICEAAIHKTWLWVMLRDSMHLTTGAQVQASRRGKMVAICRSC